MISVLYNLHKPSRDISTSFFKLPIEKGEIDLCTMSNEEVHELNLLYKRQILDLNARLNNKKAELNRIQYNEKQSTNS